MGPKAAALATIPLQDTGRLYAEYANDLKAAAIGVMKSGWWLNGVHNAAFAREFADFIDASACIPVANGTDALEIALRALIHARQIAGDEVVTVANAGGYASTAIRHIRMTPVYVDIDIQTQLVNTESLLSALGPQTAVVVLTHLYGGVIDVSSIRNRMDEAGYRHVPILEDCAQAHGAAVKGRRVGSIGDIGTFSFYPTKNLGAMGDGGAIVTSDTTIGEAVRRLHQYGWSEKYQVALSGGRNSRMDEIQAAILSVLLPRLDVMNNRRCEILAAYSDSSTSATVPVQPAHTVAHLAVFLVENRDSFRKHCLDHGILTDVHYPILDCDQPGWTTLPKRIAPLGLRQSRESVEKIVTLPCFPSMTDHEVARICSVLRSYK
jgi:dTDP-3-amino-2,3,6-trideoxy-4-keto-D-glucose/dTDP-3-amino-3,4,6-trideoxy-alpha-D-glucose/dTDP-2,6-dideoxy-D-kanosamine transaminase